MKKVFFLALMYVPSFTFGQVAWSTAGNALTSGGVLGTTTAQPLSIRTNNVERINIGSSGTIKYTGMTGTGAGLLQLSSDGTASRLNFTGDASQLLSGNGTWTNFTTLSGWNVSGSWITTTKRLGINVSSPSQALEVSGNGIFSGSVSASGFIVGGIATVQGHLNISNSVIHHAYDVAAGTRNEIYTTDREFYINSNSLYNYNTIFHQGNSGKLGVGVSNPTDKLHVYGTARVQGQLNSDSLRIGDSVMIRSKYVSGMNALSFGKPNFTYFIPACVPYGAAHATNVVNGFYLAAAGTSSEGGSLTAGHNGNYALIQSYGSDVNTGTLKINYNCGNHVAICTGSGGGNVFMTSDSGKVGIGTSTPEDKVQIKTNAFSLTFGSALSPGLSYGTSYIGFNAIRTGSGSWKTDSDGSHNGGALLYANVIGDVFLSAIPHTGTAAQTGITDASILNNTRFYVAATGQTGIGTRCIPVGYKLAVDGKIICEGIRAQNNDSTGCWPDYVFGETYVPMSIDALNAYVKTHRHLPGIPGEMEVSQNGVDLVEMNKALLKATEENSLYIIELKRSNDQLREEIEVLKALWKNKN